MRKKFSTVLACLLLIVVSAVSFTACNNDGGEPKKPDGAQKKIVYLGDSIAEAIIGVSPLSEREDFGYFGIVGQINDYNFVNRSVSGHQTKDLLCLLTDDEHKNKYADPDYKWLDDTETMTGDMLAADPGAYLTVSHIMQADIIHISIIGNDLLQAGEFFNTIILEAAQDKYDFVDATLANSKVKFKKIMEVLRIMNPDAAIVLQSVYNPIYPETPLLNAEVRKALSELSPAVSPSEYHAIGDLIIPRMNKVIEDYYNENKATDKNLYFVDVYDGFKKIHEHNPERGAKLIYSDGVHPSNEGHAVIADLIEAKLVEAGLADAAYALSQQKKLRIAQLDKLFANDNAAFIPSAKTMIKEAKTSDEVTKLFFRSIAGLTPAYLDRTEDEPFEGGKFVTEKMHFDFTAGTEIGLLPEELAFLNKAIVGLIDKDTSGITLNPDGTMEVKIMLDTGGINAILTNFGISLSDMIKNIDLTTFTKQYVVGLFPGFSFYDVEKSLTFIRDSIGAELVGLDFGNENIQLLVNALESAPENFSLPKGFVLPETLGIKYTGNYYLRTVTGEDTQEYTGVFVGQHHNKDGCPFVVMTIDGDRIYTDIMFVKTHVEAEKTAA